MDPMCIQNSWAIYSSTTVYSTTEVAGFFFRVHTLSEGARPTQGLIADSRMRRRDMARSFDSGEGSCKRLGTASLDADDSQFCSAAVTGEDVRIGLEIGS